RAAEHGVELLLRYAPGVPEWVIGDAVRVRQVVTNLASNAAKFTPQGHVLIDAACVERAHDDALIELRVEDSGIGIPADKQAHIFDKSTQADASTTRQCGGTGLGLAICRQLVELMGGTMAVASRPEAGSTFTVRVRLPIVEGRADALAEE